jgi:acyl-CoA synthetase (AMP-forming)/AMP-acid ligase II
VSASYIPLTLAAARAALRAGAPVSMALGAHAPPPEQLNVLMPVPLFHVTGLLAVTVRCFFAGSKLVFQRRWSVPDAVKLCLDQKIHMISGVPSIATAILQSGLLPEDFQFAALSYGGAAPAKRLAGDVNKRFPAAFINHGWGMTEAAGLHIAISGQDYLDRPEAVGVAIPIGAMRIVDKNRKEVPPNTLGVLHIRGGNVAKGYLDNPKANAEAYTDDGWFDTGDVGIINEEGILYLRDRAKDMIIRGGENISSEEVENAIYLDDRIAECASVPVPDDYLGELVAIAVSLVAGKQATPESIQAAAESRLRRDARPVFVYVSDSLLRESPFELADSSAQHQRQACQGRHQEDGAGGVCRAQVQGEAVEWGIR